MKVHITPNLPSPSQRRGSSSIRTRAYPSKRKERSRGPNPPVLREVASTLPSWVLLVSTLCSFLSRLMLTISADSNTSLNSSNSFDLVPNLPTPTPDQLGPARMKELMTWGTLAGTPRILSSDSLDEPPTPFRIAEPTQREVISRKLSQSASKSIRERDGIMRGVKKEAMPPPSWTTRREREGNLTPAARRLLDRTVGAQRRADAMERESGWNKTKQKDIASMRWTPTPGRG